MRPFQNVPDLQKFAEERVYTEHTHPMWKQSPQIASASAHLIMFIARPVPKLRETLILRHALLGGPSIVMAVDPRRTAAMTAIIATIPSAAFAQESYSDPAGSGAVISAISWLQGTLLGTVATVVAVIAVATVGFMMLTGRINWRYGVTVVLGCFILFGASSIVAGIHSTAALAQ